MSATIPTVHRVSIWALAVPLSVQLLVLVPRHADAQIVATSFDELQTLVRRGETIYVTDAAGRRTKGKLGELSRSSLELLIGKTGPDSRETFVPQTRLANDVQQVVVERGDPIWKGTLIGLGVVGGPWLLVCNPGTDWCYYNDGANLFRAAALITTAIGAGVGALIDASMKERTTVYYRTPERRASKILVSPLVSGSGAGVQMSLRFHP